VDPGNKFRRIAPHTHIWLFLLSIYDSNESIDFVHGKSKFFIEVLDELELFIDKKVFFDEKKIGKNR
jgi:hypothetical protein